MQGSSSTQSWSVRACTAHGSWPLKATTPTACPSYAAVIIKFVSSPASAGGALRAHAARGAERRPPPPRPPPPAELASPRGPLVRDVTLSCALLPEARRPWEERTVKTLSGASLERFLDLVGSVGVREEPSLAGPLLTGDDVGSMRPGRTYFFDVSKTGGLGGAVRARPSSLSRVLQCTQRAAYPPHGFAGVSTSSLSSPAPCVQVDSHTAYIKNASAAFERQAEEFHVAEISKTHGGVAVLPSADVFPADMQTDSVIVTDTCAFLVEDTHVLALEAEARLDVRVDHIQCAPRGNARAPGRSRCNGSGWGVALRRERRPAYSPGG